MDKQTTCDLIQHSALISDLDAGQCEALSELMNAQQLGDGEVLIDQGKVDEALHVVGEGALAVERKTSGGDTVTLHILRAGDLAGAMGFIDGTQHTATLRAVGNTTVLTLRRADLESVMNRQPELVYGIMRGIIRSVHRILGEMNMHYVELNNYITKTHGRY